MNSFYCLIKSLQHVFNARHVLVYHLGHDAYLNAGCSRPTLPLTNKYHVWLPIEEKLVQQRLRWFGHVQRRPAEAPIYNGVIRRTDNKKRGRGRLNLTWEEFLKRDLNDWCITKELALDSREWKLAIHVT
jgi:hypothetical protein